MLVEHDLHVGYFLPIPFDGVYYVEPYEMFGIDKWKAFHNVASTHAVQAELVDLIKFISTLPETGLDNSEVISTIEIQAAAEQLLEICNLSIKHCLPVIFHG